MQAPTCTHNFYTTPSSSPSPTPNSPNTYSPTAAPPICPICDLPIPPLLVLPPLAQPLPSPLPPSSLIYSLDSSLMAEVLLPPARRQEIKSWTSTIHSTELEDHIPWHSVSGVKDGEIAPLEPGDGRVEKDGKGCGERERCEERDITDMEKDGEIEDFDLEG